MLIPKDKSYIRRLGSLEGVNWKKAPRKNIKKELHSTLEDWVLMGLKKDRELPIIKGINLNQEIIREPLETL